jgi:hypothetical protein
VFYKASKKSETWDIECWKNVNPKKKGNKYTFDIVIAYPPLPPEK